MALVGSGEELGESNDIDYCQGNQNYYLNRRANTPYKSNIVKLAQYLFYLFYLVHLLLFRFIKPVY